MEVRVMVRGICGVVSLIMFPPLMILVVGQPKVVRFGRRFCERLTLCARL